MKVRRLLQGADLRSAHFVILSFNSCFYYGLKTLPAGSGILPLNVSASLNQFLLSYLQLKTYN